MVYSRNLILLCFGFLFFIACEEDIINPYYTTSNDEDVDLDYTTITVSEALAVNCTTHENSTDYNYDLSQAVDIYLSNSSISSSSNHVDIADNMATITASGIYRLSGAISDGQILVDSDDGDPVYLVLDNVNITNTTNAPIFVKNAKIAFIILADGSDNYLTDQSNYAFEGDDDEPNATLFSKENMTICGDGSLTISANYNDAIASKDGLVIKNGNITINAVDDGIRGKDYLIIHDGTFAITAGGDGLKSDNEDDASMGYILVEGGKFNITSGGDAIQGKTDVMITGGNIAIKSGGGCTSNISDDLSAKGLKAGANLIIDDIETTINSADDALHSNVNITINGGIYVIATGDDGVHADSLLVVNDAEINITKSYEGLESSHMVINGGNIHLVSSDDGLNVAGGNDSSGGWPGGGHTTSSNGYYLNITGGYIVVNAASDGLDANGSIIMSGGTVLVNGPTNNGNGPLDYDATFQMDGGYIIAAGSAGMAQATSSSSSQYSVLIAFSSTLSAGTMFHNDDSDGNDIMSFCPAKNYQSILFSSDSLEKGEAYSVYYGGSCSGNACDGLYNDGGYTAGTKLGSFTISNKVTTLSVR